MIPHESRFKVATEKFLSSNLTLQIELDNLSPVVAGNLGITCAEYRQNKLVEAFDNYAKTYHQDPSRLIIDLCAENEDERKEMLFEQAKKIAKNLGIDVLEYCNQNHIEVWQAKVGKV